MGVQGDITAMLCRTGSQQAPAADELLPLVYDQLRDLAGRYLRRERDNHTLQATALVHEAYLNLVDQSRVQWQGRAHFLAVAATAMRRILVNHAKQRARLKRGGDRARLSLDADLMPAHPSSVDLIALDDALNDLAGLDAQQARIVELRYFGGLTVEETACALQVSQRTVHREWSMARAWLRGELQEGRAP